MMQRSWQLNAWLPDLVAVERDALGTSGVLVNISPVLMEGKEEVLIRKQYGHLSLQTPGFSHLLICLLS